MAAKTISRPLKKSEFQSWNELVLGDSLGGSIYALTDYLATLSEVTNGSFFVLGAFRGEELLGGIPIYEQRTRFGTSVENRLLLHYNGMVFKVPGGAQGHKKAKNLLCTMDSLLSGLRERQWAHLVIHQRGEVSDLRPFLSRPWSICPTYTYLVSLDDVEGLWGRIDKNVRRLVRSAEAEGYVVEESLDFEPFYRLHYQVHQRKGAPLYLDEEPFKKYFEKLTAAKLARLYYAKSGMGDVAAGLLVLAGQHNLTHSVCAVSDEAHLRAGATPFLRWKTFEALSADGYKLNDLTDASLNKVSNFKAQLGGELSVNYQITRPDRFDYRVGSCVRNTLDQWFG